MSQKHKNSYAYVGLWYVFACIVVIGCQKHVPVREIAFVSDRSGNQDIYLFNIDADSIFALTQHEGEDWSPAWTPDGSKLAFASTRDGGWNIYLLDMRDRSITRLTDSGKDRRPSWSPNGKRMAFTSDRDGDMEIYVTNADGSDIINLSNHRARDDRPIWSPDGNRIAFSSLRDGAWNIYMLTLRTGELQKLPVQREPNYPGVWFGRTGQQHLLLESNFDIILYSFATDEMRTLGSGSSKEGNPDRSGDGEWIVFESDRSGDYDVWSMKSDGSALQNLTNHPAFDWYPRWRPPQ